MRLCIPKPPYEASIRTLRSRGQRYRGKIFRTAASNFHPWFHFCREDQMDLNNSI